MKRKVICVLAILTLLLTTFAGCKSSAGLTELTLNEVAHSIFYAPMYVAFEKGYFEDEGL
ncbi:MAG: ytlA, partial [Lachnospiraceae bacterium]|nr:ytlA [Lachnospiraceae bacterium]